MTIWNLWELHPSSFSRKKNCVNDLGHIFDHFKGNDEFNVLALKLILQFYALIDIQSLKITTNEWQPYENVLFNQT